MNVAGTEGLVGRVIDKKLRLDELLGAGAAGAVYRAQHLALDKPVAIKILHASHATDPTIVGRFKAEARAASRLDHPNSIRILDFGEDGDDRLLYIAMEYAPGEDLQSLLEREGTIESWRIAAIMSQACGALAVAHDQGVVHRDLKPGNIILLTEQTEDGLLREVVKVCDFGLAKILDVNPDEATNGPLTKQGVIFGTPAYMPPEQASGEKVDGRGDIYACGCIIFKMASGRAVFTADNTTGLLMKHIMDPAPALDSVAPNADPRLVEIVAKCLQKSPDDRFGSMRELLDALRPIAAEAPADAMALVNRAVPPKRTVSMGPAPTADDSFGDTLHKHGAPMTNAPTASASRTPILLSAIGSLLLVAVGGAFVYVVLQDKNGEPKEQVAVAMPETPPPKMEVEPPPPPPPPPMPVEPPKMEVEEPPPPPPPPKRRRRRPAKKSPPPPPKTVEPPPPPVKVEPPPPPPPPAPPPPVKLETPPPPPPKLPVGLPSDFGFSAKIAGLSVSGGMSSKRVQNALVRGMDDVKKCLRVEVERRNKATKGTVKVKARISVRGRLDSFEASGGFKGAGDCVEKGLRGLRMPRPDTGAAYVTFEVRYGTR